MPVTIPRFCDVQSKTASPVRMFGVPGRDGRVVPLMLVSRAAKVPRLNVIGTGYAPLPNKYVFGIAVTAPVPSFPGASVPVISAAAAGLAATAAMT